MGGTFSIYATQSQPTEFRTRGLYTFLLHLKYFFCLYFPVVFNLYKSLLMLRTIIFIILIKLKDTKAKKSIGSKLIKLKELLGANDMVLDQKFHIKTSESGCYVQMRMCLRVNYFIHYICIHYCLLFCFSLHFKNFLLYILLLFHPP